jgi:hypothetical protein
MLKIGGERKMIHHHITVYGENDRWYAEAWLQFNLFGWCICFWKRKTELDQFKYMGELDEDGD